MSQPKPSTPTACPKCGRLPDFCDHREIVATQLAEPRQPDNEMNELLMETIVRGQNKPDIYERVNRMQLAQEEIERAARGEPDTSARDAESYSYGVSCDAEGLYSQAEIERAWLAGHARALKEMGAERDAALAKLKEFDEYYTFQNLERVEKQLAAAQSERDQQQEWAMKFQRERDAAELRAGEYEKALEKYESVCASSSKAGGDWAAREVLTKHRRGEGS